jgi:hypothetical protein
VRLKVPAETTEQLASPRFSVRLFKLSLTSSEGSKRRLTIRRREVRLASEVATVYIARHDR